MNVKEAWENNDLSINEAFTCKYQTLIYNCKIIMVGGEWIYSEIGDLMELFLLDNDSGVIMCDIKECDMFELIEEESE